MKQLFLASSLSETGSLVAKHLNPKQYSRVLFVTTASEVEPGDKGWLQNDREGLQDAGFTTEDYTFTGKTREEIKEKLENIDAVCLGGGNTYYLLDQMRKTGAFELIKEKVEAGLPFIGSSAGAIAAGPETDLIKDLDDPKKAPDLTDHTGLELTDIALVVHWGASFLESRGERTIRALEDLFDHDTKILFLRDNHLLYVEDETFQILKTPAKT